MVANYGSMKSTKFIAEVAREVSAYFVRSGHPVKSSVRYQLAQFWWGADRTLHYEIWVHERNLQFELGLHLESTPERNTALYNAFSRHFIEIQGQLGESIWLEEWDKGWCRVYETVPLFPMDEARVYAVAGRLCEIMEYLQPMLETLDQ